MSRDFQMVGGEMDREQRQRDIAEDERSCTCHPDDHPPVPCPKKYALTECRSAAVQAERDELRALLNKIRDQAVIKRDLACERCENMPAMEWGHIVSQIDRVLNPK